MVSHARLVPERKRRWSDGCFVRLFFRGTCHPDRKLQVERLEIKLHIDSSTYPGYENTQIMLPSYVAFTAVF